MNHVAEQIIAIVSAAIGLAIVAVLVSNQANTSGVISSASSGLATIIGAAVAPVTGGSGTGNAGISTSFGTGLPANGIQG